MTKISAVVFDLGNVLLPFTYIPMFNRLENIEIGLGEKFKSFYEANYFLHRSFEKGELPENEFIDIMLASVNNKINAETFCKFYSEIFTENKELTALLPLLKEKYSLVLLSNTNGIHKEYGWGQYKFLSFFDKMILSHEVHAVKPEEKIYKAVESFTQKPPREHIFIDDINEYVEGAKQLGWDGIQYLNFDALIEQFKLKGIL